MKNLLHRDRQLLTRITLGILIFAVLTGINPTFGTAPNVFVILEGFAFIGLAALAVGTTMIAGELDMSVGSMAAVAGIIAVRVAHLGLLPSVLIALLATMALGALQGLAIGLLRIPSLVFTVGTMIALRGLAFLLSGERSISVPDLNVSDMVSQRLFVFSPYSLVTIALFVLLGLFFAYSRYGREAYAIGGGRNESIAAGVPFLRPIVVVFTISGGLAGLTGALISLKSGGATPAGLDNLLLQGIAAVLVGGVRLSGGKGSVLGMAIGTLIIRSVTSFMNLRGAPFYIDSFATGILLMCVLALELLFETPEAQDRWRRWRRHLAIGRTPAGP